jgi:hypothetical protein
MIIDSKKVLTTIIHEVMNEYLVTIISRRMKSLGKE